MIDFSNGKGRTKRKHAASSRKLASSAKKKTNVRSTQLKCVFALAKGYLTKSRGETPIVLGDKKLRHIRVPEGEESLSEAKWTDEQLE